MFCLMEVPMLWQENEEVPVFWRPVFWREREKPMFWQEMEVPMFWLWRSWPMVWRRKEWMVEKGLAMMKLWI